MYLSDRCLKASISLETSFLDAYTMSKNNITRVFISGSSYTFLLYLLLSEKEEIESTFYFFGNGISEQVQSYLRSQCCYFDDTDYNTPLKAVCLAMKIRINKYFKWKFLKDPTLHYFGHDHKFISWPIVDNNLISVLEDGIGNYYPVKFHQAPKGGLHWLKKLIYGPLYAERNLWFGCSNHVDILYLTNMWPDSPIMKNEKVRIVDIYELWNQSNEEKKKLILDIFGITFGDILELKKYKKIVLTQPLDIDMGISEDAKVRFYAENIGGNNVDDIVIKSHPRETTDYSEYFPNAFCFNKKFPSQLLSLCGVEFDEIYTINSSGVFGAGNKAIVHELKFNINCNK